MEVQGSPHPQMFVNFAIVPVPDYKTQILNDGPDGQFKFPHPWSPQIPPCSTFRLRRFGVDSNACCGVFECVTLTLELQHRAPVYSPVQNGAGHRHIPQILAPVLQLAQANLIPRLQQLVVVRL